MPQFQPFEKVLILALDSVCWELLLPLVNSGVMPALGAFLNKAHYGILESTLPPHTAPAWTTFLTGQDPGRHGVLNFVHYDPIGHKFQFNDSSAQREMNFLTRLTNQGTTCGSIFLPRSYPPYPLKGGYIVSGFETPNTDVRFTEPEELRDEVLDVSPGLHFNFEEDWADDRSEKGFEGNIDRAIAAIDLLERLAIHFQRERPTDLQVAYLQATDILFHKAWKWCDPATSSASPTRRDQVHKFFRRVDQMLGRVFCLHTDSRTSQRFKPGVDERTLRVLVSDHGHGPSRGRIYMNNLLRDWGFLKPLGHLRNMSHRIKLLTMNAATRRARSRELLLDWSRTKAYLAHAAIYGFVYVNLKGREPEGSVAPEQYESVRQELIDKFLSEKIPGTTEPLFTKVYKGEEVFARKQELNLPDLVVVPADGFFPRQKLTSSAPVKPAPNSPGGVHRTDGVYAMQGTGITPSQGLSARANIADIAPTILAAMGASIPSSMSGRPMLHLFSDPPQIRIDVESASPEHPQTSPVYNQEEQQAVEKRLADLGYLE
ncbi:MAG TPA: alkaline phosphatase family protein [Planctomycetota bacterium]|jgi:predicted AlkP superfamily phosphohydrolase/phosphomutase